jgi:hypothetical protein
MFGEKARVLNTTSVALKASMHSVLAVAVSAAVAFTSGCATMYTTSQDTAPVTGAAIQGRVKGGQFPVSGGSIGLYVAGSTGYGSSGGNLLTAPVMTAADGSFSISHDYTCPSASSPVYLTASGGNPGIGSNNSSIMLVAPLGPCGNLGTSTFININEVTTAAAAIALGQFFTPTFGSSSADSFGASSTNQTGLTNAFATVNNLVNISTGAAVTSSTLTNGGLSVTTTPESAKLYTIANILAACVNSDGGGSSPCQTTLFPDVTPAGGVQPTDTLQAAVYMSLNPTSNNSNTSSANLTALYGLQTPTAPFAGSGTQPTDWTVGIRYTDTVAATLLLQPQNIAADASGNIWVANSSGSSTNGSLVEFGPTGTPMVSALSSATAGTGINTATPRNMAIDTNGNVWITTSSSAAYVFEYFPTSGIASTYSTSKSSFGLAIDGNNNVFVGSASGTSHFELFEFPGGNIADPIEYPIASSTPGTPGVNGTNNFILPEQMAFDTAGNLWMSNGAGGTSATQIVQLSNIDPSACIGGSITYPCLLTTSLTSNTYTGISQGSMLGAFGVAAGSNSLWVANAGTGSNSLTNLSLSGATVNNGANYGTTGALNGPHYIAVDGAGNAWVTDNKVTSPGSVAEFSGDGTVLSPTTPTGFSHVGLSNAQGITVDASGNVWVANNAASGATDANSIFELVGSAAPTVTPIALSLKNNKVGQRP